MTNVSILKGKIVEKNVTQEAVADDIGMDRSTFYRKMKNEGKQFTVEEIQKLRKILELSNDDIIKIFFTQEVA